jgi:hypothetical protein
LDLWAQTITAAGKEQIIGQLSFDSYQLSVQQAVSEVEIPK